MIEIVITLQKNKIDYCLESWKSFVQYNGNTTGVISLLKKTRDFRVTYTPSHGRNLCYKMQHYKISNIIYKNWFILNQI